MDVGLTPLSASSLSRSNRRGSETLDVKGRFLSRRTPLLDLDRIISTAYTWPFLSSGDCYSYTRELLEENNFSLNIFTDSLKHVATTSSLGIEKALTQLKERAAKGSITGGKAHTFGYLIRWLVYKLS